MKKSIRTPALGLLGATILGGGLASATWAEANPFAVIELQGGYQIAAAEKNAEGKCGAEKSEAEGKCGGEKANGEGKCGDAKANSEGKCGGEKADAEGKCGEGKCGADKAAKDSD